MAGALNSQAAEHVRQRPLQNSHHQLAPFHWSACTRYQYLGSHTLFPAGRVVEQKAVAVPEIAVEVATEVWLGFALTLSTRLAGT